MSVLSMGLVAAGLVGALIVQGALLRVSHRRRLQALRSRHDQQLTALHGEFEQMRLRLLQLQGDHALRSQSLLRSDPAARELPRPELSVRQALERQLDADVDGCGAPSADGFEDTQILPHEAQQPGLLMQ